MTGKLLILTGAPESHRLDWAPSSLLTTFQPSIAQFALLQPPGPPVPSTWGTVARESSRRELAAVWRSLPLHRTHIRTGFSQLHNPHHLVGAIPSSADFLTTASLVSFEAASQGRLSFSQEGQEGDEESSRLVAEFYEHSLAVHDEIASSQLVPQHPASSSLSSSQDAVSSKDITKDITKDNTSTSTEASFVSDTTTSHKECDGDTTAPPPPLKAPLRPGRGPAAADHLSDLEDIPPAAYLVSIRPATMTVSLIVGIIHIAAPRTIKTHYGALKTLVEVLVGDDTKSGFSVTFWLPAAAVAEKDDDGAAGGGGVLLAELRSQDVVLMQNVALNVFRGQVYGGSLRRGLTRVALLYRGRKSSAGAQGDEVEGYYDVRDLAQAGREQQQPHPQLEKTRRVRDWVLQFVGGGGGGAAGEVNKATRTRKGEDGRATTRDWNQPPPLDSQ